MKESGGEKNSQLTLLATILLGLGEWPLLMKSFFISYWVGTIS